MLKVIVVIGLVLFPRSVLAQPVPAPGEEERTKEQGAAPADEPVVAAAPHRDASASDGISAAEELVALVALVRHAPESPRWPVAAMGLRDDPPSLATAESEHPVVVASARLVNFESRFGSAPQALDGWRAMQAAAKHALGELKAREHGESPAQIWARSFLEYASGDSEAAQRTLLGEARRDIDLDCWGHAQESLAWLSASRAVMTDLLEASPQPLLPYHAAAHYFCSDDWADMFGRWRVAGDLMLARYAELLAEHEQWAALETIRDLLVERRADSLGERLVRKVLRPADAEPPRPDETLFTVWTSAEDCYPGVDWIGTGGYAFVVGERSARKTWRPLGFTVCERPGRDPEIFGWLGVTDFRVVAPSDDRAAKIATAFRTRDDVVPFGGWR